MCPLSTVTEPKRFNIDSAFSESSVPQPQSLETVHNGMWAKTTIGVEAERPFTSSASQASCSGPSLPMPPALRSITLLRPMKWTPFWLKEYQPVPLVFLSKPTWLSEICKKVKPASAACADPIRLDFGTPPATVHKTPVPAHSMHSRTSRRP